jgi:intermediate filament protein if
MYHTMTSSSLGPEDSAARLSQLTKGEMSAKTTYQRSAKGPVTISECSADGKFITLENTGRKDELLGEWNLKRNIDGVDRPDYCFPQDFTVRMGSKIKLWAQGCKPSTAPATDIETDEPSWGTGANINTRLVSPSGEDRATHVQKTIYT